MSSPGAQVSAPGLPQSQPTPSPRTSVSGPAAAPATRTGPAGAPAPRRQTGSTSTRTTPQWLRLWMVLSVTAAVAFGVLTLLTMITTMDAQERAEASSAQTIRVHEIQAQLLRADALATQVFLTGKPEQPSQRAEYDAAMDRAAQLIVEASQAEPADQEALVALNQIINGYVGSMERARAAAPKGPVEDATALQEAGDVLRSGTMPVLDSLAATNADRASSAMASLGTPWLLGAALVGIVAQLACCVWCARRFRRVINVPLLVSTGVMVVTWVLATATLQTADTQTRSQYEAAFTTATHAAVARIAGNEAKAQESRGLISPNAAADSERVWRAQDTKVRTALADLGDGAALTAWSDYASEHEQIRALSASGKSDEAVARAVRGGDAGADHRFRGFDLETAQLIDRTALVSVDTLRTGAVPAMVMAGLVPLSTVAAAILAGVGIRARQREYRS